MKKTIAFLLSVLLLLSAAMMPTGAADNAAEAPVSQAALVGHRTLCGLGYLFGRLVRALTGMDETRVPKAKALNENWNERSEPLFNGDAQQTLSAETWRMTELVFKSKKSYDDPFSDVTLDLLLCGNGRVYTIPGFWDGDNTWKVRFVCPSEGTWQFKTVCSDSNNKQLHAKTGIVNCKPYSGTLDIFRHGFITTRYGKKYLTYDDGTPFFYAGDTHWAFGRETQDMVRTICAKRAEQRFTAIQTEPIGATFNLADGVDAQDLEGLRDYDVKTQIIADAGLVHANAQFFWPADFNQLIENFGGYSDQTIKVNTGLKIEKIPDYSDGVKTYVEKLSRYWVARFGAYPVIWTLGQEIDRDFYDVLNEFNNPYILVANAIAKYDPYTQPLTAHQENSGRTVAYGHGLSSGEAKFIYYPGAKPSIFRKVDAHTMYAAQWFPSLTERADYFSCKDYWYNGQGKPVINYESHYNYLWTKEFGSRAQYWFAYLNGMYGCAWGGQDTWNYLSDYNEYWDTDDGVDVITAKEKQDATWESALEYPSCYQLAHMRSFLEGTKWYELIPRFNDYAYFVPCLNVLSLCASNKKNTEIVIYFYSFSDESVAQRSNTKNGGGYLTGTVGSLVPFAEYTYQWFDPINGKFIEEGTFRASPLGTWFPGLRPDDTDMTLLIRKKDVK